MILSIYRSSAQSEALTSSPYSLYGLGIINQTGIGSANGMGYTGIGLKTDAEINNLNPANYGNISQNTFLYDVGLRGQYNTYGNLSNNESKSNLNFSNLAMAFSLGNNMGMGISMVPYTDVGYSILGIRSNIEGSNETFESNVNGLGGLSDLKLNLGYNIGNGIRVGLSTSLLFGNIVEEESFRTDMSSFLLTEQTNYSGIRLGFGLQYDLTENLTFGSTIQLPTTMSANLKRSVLKNLEGAETSVVVDELDDASDFTMPLELGFGLSAQMLNSIKLNIDYKKNFWAATGQTENIGAYVNQDIYALGLEYCKNSTGYKYGQRVRYRLGVNYDNGYLAINNQKIDGYNLTAGVGIPVGSGLKSKLNLSYSYGAQGHIQNILIKENFHLITLNLSLEDIWFVKRKIN